MKIDPARYYYKNLETNMEMEFTLSEAEQKIVDANYERLRKACEPVEDKHLCDCHRNYGKDCLFPEKYREEGCN